MDRSESSVPVVEENLRCGADAGAATLLLRPVSGHTRSTFLVSKRLRLEDFAVTKKNLVRNRERKAETLL
jgi:hypothetical protein